MYVIILLYTSLVSECEPLLFSCMYINVTSPVVTSWKQKWHKIEELDNSLSVTHLIKEFQIKLASLLSIAYVVGNTDIIIIIIVILLSKSVKIKIHRTIILPVVLYTCETWSLT